MQRYIFFIFFFILSGTTVAKTIRLSLSDTYMLVETTELLKETLPPETYPPEQIIGPAARTLVSRSIYNDQGRKYSLNEFYTGPDFKVVEAIPKRERNYHLWDAMITKNGSLYILASRFRMYLEVWNGKWPKLEMSKKEDLMDICVSGGNLFKEAYFVQKGTDLYAVSVFENCNNYDEKPLIFYCWRLDEQGPQKVTLPDVAKLMPLRTPEREIKAIIPGFRTDFRYTSKLTQEIWEGIRSNSPNKFFTKKYRSGWEELLHLAYLEPRLPSWWSVVVLYFQQNPNPKSIPAIQTAFEASYTEIERIFEWRKIDRWEKSFVEQEQRKITRDRQRCLINLLFQCISENDFSPVLSCLEFDEKWYRERNVPPFLINNIVGKTTPCTSLREYVKNVFLQKFGNADEWNKLFGTATPPDK